MIRKKPHHVPPHLHNAIELVYVTKGEVELGIGYELYHMEKGDFAIVFPDLIHHYQVFSKGENEVYQFYASLELSGPFMALLQKKCPENPVIASADLHREVKNALSCLIKDQKVSEVVGQAYLQIILYRCRETFRFIEKDSVGSNDLIYAAMTYLLSHFQEELTLGKVASALGTNKFALSKIFSGIFHTNFNQYLNEIRLNYATSLLENTDRLQIFIWKLDLKARGHLIEFFDKSMGGRLVNIEKHGGKNRTCLIITYRKETYRQVNLKDIFKEKYYISIKD